jgi:RNA polymerase sigma-70 factor (ECF subfamily)
MTMLETIKGVDLMPEADLLGRARAGDRAAREELFSIHFPVAYRVACRLLGHKHDAEDAVHDAFLKALVHLAEFDGRSEFRTWLLRIVTNASLDLGRRRRRRPWVSFDEKAFEEGEGSSLGTADPAQGLHREDLRKRISQALDRLSPATRATFVLFAEAELSYKEIAECQGVPIGTVMSRLHYARQKLQSFLEDMQADS